VIQHLAAFVCVLLHSWDATLLQHVLDVQACDVDSETTRRVLISLRSFSVRHPVHNEGAIFPWFVLHQTCSHNRDADTCWAYILLSARINNIELLPINGLGAEVAGHVTDHELALWLFVMGELIELKSLNCLIVAVVEILCFLADFPLIWLSDIGVLVCSVARALCDRCAEFLRFLDRCFTPSTSRQVI